MKKGLLVLVCLIIDVITWGQVQNPCANCDIVITGRSRNYYYGDWYDTCRCYLMGQDCANLEAGHNYYYVKKMVTPEPLIINGLTALTSYNPLYDQYHQPAQHPEYLYLYQKGEQKDMWIHDTAMILLDSVRWDTAQPHYVLIETFAGSNEYVHCYAYDAYFNQPIRVDSAFGIRGTGYSNNVYDDDGNFVHRIYKIQYATFEGNGCHPKSHPLYYNFYATSPANMWYEDPRNNSSYGNFLPIVDNDSLSAVSSDIINGTVSGSGYYPHGHRATIEAVPNSGYTFGYWNDGVTTNPRRVTMTQDSTFKAYFIGSTPVNVAVVPDDETRGHVHGGGNYLPGDTAILTAVPEQGHWFKRWSDGDTTNPRYFIVTRDTAFVAYFSDGAGLDTPRGTVGITVSPNPAHTRFTVACPIRIEEITVMSASGATVLRLSPKAETAIVAVADWQPGAYVVHARTANGSASKKIIVN